MAERSCAAALPPPVFGAPILLVINKADLLPYVDFDVKACTDYAHQVNPGLPVLVVSATTGDGLDSWYRWIQDKQRVPSSDRAPVG